MLKEIVILERDIASYVDVLLFYRMHFHIERFLTVHSVRPQIIYHFFPMKMLPE